MRYCGRYTEQEVLISSVFTHDEKLLDTDSVDALDTRTKSPRSQRCAMVRDVRISGFCTGKMHLKH